ncbi:MOV10 [Lepeophtheirus salmonis]|uniref:MOV10 n=1 Tax=Lepeophtheirus salmonis TaxID=72036 RepID=A0A7R8CCH6_LEPSM|nr:MOV10 [Lepeophtheirus salmonis]CAF2763784.1 MOV10 [Lepeophtheirus salmonis]
MIEHILGFSSYPFPYIIFGPPGTGKSSTVAEAIKQVHHDPKKTRILVCAPSNTAVDVVTEKILDDISPCSVLHVVAARHKEKYDSKTGPFKESLQIGGNVRGDMVRPKNCKSFFNNTEVEIVQKNCK